MNIQKLDYFITIAETGNLTKAAEKLFVSQPSLSQYLKRLENSLGTELFDRSASPLKLTYAGEKYYAYALDARRREDHIRKELQDIRDEVSGQLRLGFALWRGSTLLPEVFPQFHEKYPKVKIELFEGRGVQLQSALLNDNLDIAVMNLPRTLNYDKFACEVFLEEEIMLAAPTRHPYVQEVLRHQDPGAPHPKIPVDVLRRLPLIITKPGQNLTYEISRILELNHIEPDILLDTGNLTTAINLVARQMACTFVPEEGAKVCERPGDVTYFSLSDSAADCIWDLAVIYRRDAYLSRIARLFNEELHALGG